MSSIPPPLQTGNSTSVCKRPRRRTRRKDGPALIQSDRTNRTRNGEAFDRSVPLTRSDAEKMAAALANLPGFTAVQPMPTKHAAPDGKSWFVRWHRTETLIPSSISEQQQTRVERAIHQAPEMEAFLVGNDDPEIPRRWVLHRYPDSAEFGLYLVTFNSCTCPDMTFRGHKLSACKHIHFFWGLQAEQRRKRTQAERELDAKAFGW